MRNQAPALLILLLLLSSCGRESRTESRQRRLDTFRHTLPAEVRNDFDAIEHEEDCDSVAIQLSLAREADSSLDARLDSIKHAELIDYFSDRDMVYFFWFYFAHAIETRTVPEP